MNIAKNKSIGIIILNYVTYKDSIKCTDNLLQQEDVAINILIVDNCSPNNSFEILRNNYETNNRVEVIKSKKNGGYAYGNNFGLKYIDKNDYEFIGISNNDIIIDDRFLLSKLITIESTLNRPAFLAPLMITNNKPSPLTAWKIPSFIDDILNSLRISTVIFGNRVTYKDIKRKGKIKNVECLSGSFFIFRANIIYDLGLFDENTFLYCEEIILGIKVKRAGLKNYLVQDLSFIHLNSKTTKKSLSKITMHKHLTNSRIYYYKKYLNASIFKLFIIKTLSIICIIEILIINFLKSIYIRAN